MTETWIPLAIGIGLASIALLFVIWFGYGVWLAQHRSAARAQKRWKYYNRTRRKIRQYRLRNVESVKLEIAKSTHGQRVRFERRRRRGKVAK